MPKHHDDLASGLDAVAKGRGGGTVPKVLQLFGDQPEVLESIQRARRDRKLSRSEIAQYFTSRGHPISEGAIQTYLRSVGID